MYIVQCYALSTENEIDQRVKDFLDMEDVDIIPDLRAHNKGRQKSFDTFWSVCERVLNEEIGFAVDDRRHDLVTHVASAVSVRDLWERAKALCPDDASISSQTPVLAQEPPRSCFSSVHWSS